MKKLLSLMLVAIMVAFAVSPLTAQAANKDEINRDADAALKNLYESEQVAKMLGEKAVAVLVFPKIVKGGFVVGGQYGDGVLREGTTSIDYYRSISGSFGLQAGVQTFGYALFFMNQKAVDYLKKSKGWEIGVGPNVVIVDKGAAKNITTTTAKDDVYAFVFSQKGLMAGIGLQGTKITKIHPK
jgi:lipid-binding SYLF domain-containing protein